MTNKIDVDHLAKLAKLTITKEEKEKLGEQLEEILDYVDQLKEVDTDDVEATARTIVKQNTSFQDGEELNQELSDLNDLKASKLKNLFYFVVEKIKWNEK